MSHQSLQPAVDFGHAAVLAVVGIKLQNSGIDWAGVAAFLGASALFLQGLARVVQAASVEIRAWRSAPEVAAEPKPSEPKA